MIGLHRSSDSAIEQLVFVWENFSVAAANREISVVFPVNEDDVEVGCLSFDGEGLGGGDGYEEAAESFGAD